MSERLEQEKRAFKNALQGLDYDRAVVLGSYPGMLKKRVEELEAIRQFYANPTIYDAREGMAILKDCGDKAREGLK